MPGEELCPLVVASGVEAVGDTQIWTASSKGTDDDGDDNLCMPRMGSVDAAGGDSCPALLVVHFGIRGA